MDSQEVHEDLVTDIYLSFDNEEQVKDAMRREAARLNLTLAEFLHPIKARELVDTKQSPILEAVLRYFEHKEQEPK